MKNSISILRTDRLKELLKQRKIKQRHFASMIDITEQAMSKLLNGHVQPSAETIKRMIEVLDIPADYLFGIEVSSIGCKYCNGSAEILDATIQRESVIRANKNTKYKTVGNYSIGLRCLEGDEFCISVEDENMAKVAEESEYIVCCYYLQFNYCPKCGRKLFPVSGVEYDA